MTMPNFGYHLARAQGAATRAAYRSLLPLISRRAVAVTRSFPFEVYSYSGEAMLPEQVASLRSFLTFVGRPPRFAVVSDGTHTARSIELLQRIDRCVAVEPVTKYIPAGYPPPVDNYFRSHATGRQLALIMSLPKNGPALYTDSDVLFFGGADDLCTIAAQGATPAFYLRDCQFSGDERLLRGSERKLAPVNTGFLFLFRTLDWSSAIARFLELAGAPTFFTNQTVAHLAMHVNAAEPLDARKYVLQLDDQFVFADRYRSDAIAMRHYVNPVRHKFWTGLASR